jgi:hypothetical protein
MQILWPESQVLPAHEGLLIGWHSVGARKHRAAVLIIVPCPEAADKVTELTRFIKKTCADFIIMQAKSTDSRKLTVLGLWKPQHSESDKSLQLDIGLDSLQLSLWLTMSSSAANRPVLQSVRLADSTSTLYHPSCYIVYYKASAPSLAEHAESIMAGSNKAGDLLSDLGSTLELIQQAQYLIPYLHGQQQAVKAATSSDSSEATANNVQWCTQNRSLFLLHLCNRCNTALHFISKSK